MSSINQFDWVDFYKELAHKLLPYKENRQELVAKIYRIFEISGFQMPDLEENNQIIDIDPFTIFALFNRRLREDNRIKIISAIAELFSVATPLPTSFAGIPVLDNRNFRFYQFANEREDKDIDCLWEFFDSALAYAASQTPENRMKFSKYFDLVINMARIGRGKITIGLYWIVPDTFLSLDSRTVRYVYTSGKMPENLMETLPTIDHKISSGKYLEIVEKLRAYIQSSESPFENFWEFSHEAWRYSVEVKLARAEDAKAKQEKDTANEDADDEKPETKSESDTIGDVEEDEIEYVAYGAEDFLNEVYMSKENYDTLVALVREKKNVILQGAPGVGKTFAAKRLAYSMMGVKDPNRVVMVQFHQSYSYEDFIMGFRPYEEGFELKRGTFYNFCKAAEEDIENDYFFIIDEINRGNLSKIFGELFMLIENDKRGVKLQLLYSNEDFSVPRNVYIIGMMNTADRSLAMLDYALRRRFSFYEMKPAFQTDGFQKYRANLSSDKFNNLIDCVEELNGAISNDDSLGEGFCIGHSYFCNLREATDQALNRIVEFELIPLLKEYWFDEPAKVVNWARRLRDSIK